MLPLTPNNMRADLDIARSLSLLDRRTHFGMYGRAGL